MKQYKSDRISILHVVDSLHPRSGGPSRTVVQLADGLGDCSLVSVTLLSQGRVGEDAISSQCASVERRIALSRCSLALKLGLPINRLICERLSESKPSIVHSHGLWAPTNHWAARHAHKINVPHIIHPRGMLEPWALNFRRWKKLAALAIYQRRHLNNAHVLIATSGAEYESIRQAGLDRPVAVIPNGVRIEASVVGSKEPNRSERIVLFLSRIHPKKGLLNLVHAWKMLSRPGWRLHIAGPSEGDHIAEVMSVVRQIGVSDTISYLGAVEGDRKVAVFREADLFVLPTYSENFGLVVAEALSHGLPVVTTRGAPWCDLERFGCGWWIEIGVEPLARALLEAMNLSDCAREAMGERGRVYVTRFNWDEIARQMVEVYCWSLGRCAKPSFVKVD